jgi:hypothetical protein
MWKYAIEIVEKDSKMPFTKTWEWTVTQVAHDGAVQWQEVGNNLSLHHAQLCAKDSLGKVMRTFT